MNKYSHLATKEEIKNRLQEISQKEVIDKSGIPLFYGNDKIYIDNSETHNLIIGSTGSGKTQAFILPMINLSKRAGESMIINDPNGELYRICANDLEKENYKTIILDFKDAKFGNNWNPFILIYHYYINQEHDLAIRLLEELGYYLFYEPNSNETDPFWINTTIDYFTGLVLYLFEKQAEDKINLLNIYQLSNWMKEDSNHKEVLKQISKNSEIYYNLAGTLEAPPETKGSILSVFNQKIKKYISRRNITNMLCNNDISIDEILEEPTAVFIVSGASDYANNLIPLFVTQIIECARNNDNHKRINLLLDEFDSMIPIKNFSSMIQSSRSLNIRFTITINSYAHLNYLYGEQNARLLRYCFGNIIYLLSEDMPTIEEFSKYCGTIKEEGKEQPLISTEELRILKPFEAVISMIRMMPIKTTLIPYYKWNLTEENTEKEMPARKEIEINKYEE